MVRRLSGDSIFIAVAGLIYLPFVFLGFGADGDTYSLVAAAQALRDGDGYRVSRAPGFPAHEVASAALLTFRSVGTNLGSLACALVTLWSFLRIAGTYAMPHRHLLAAVLAVHPLFWINATSTIDYVWGLALMLSAHLALIRQHGVLAGVLAGTAVGTRITAIVWLAAWAVAAATRARPDRRPVVLALTVGSVVAIAWYVLPFVHAGYSLDFLWPVGRDRFLAYYVPEWSLVDRAVRVAFKNVVFWGLAGFVVLVPLLLKSVAWLRPAATEGRARELIIVSVAIIAGFEIAFFVVPAEPAYLLPIVPYLLFLLGLAGRATRRWLTTLGVAVGSAAVVQISLLAPESTAGSTPRLRPSITSGALLTDVRERVRMHQRHVAPEGRIRLRTRPVS